MILIIPLHELFFTLFINYFILMFISALPHRMLSYFWGYFDKLKA